jgi:hypothetical protein
MAFLTYLNFDPTIVIGRPRQRRGATGLYNASFPPLRVTNRVAEGDPISRGAEALYWPQDNQGSAKQVLLDGGVGGKEQEGQ